MKTNTSVFGIFKSMAEADNCVARLRSSGFRNTDISILIPDNEGTRQFSHEKHSKAPEGAAVGGTTGVVVGGVLGWLAGVGALAIPGLGPFIAAGPIMGALAGAGSAGVVGGLVGGLAGFGIPEYEAKRYEGRLKSGGILLSCHCGSSEWVARAEEVLKNAGAEDISSSSEASADYVKKAETKPYGYGVSR